MGRRKLYKTSFLATEATSLVIGKKSMTCGQNLRQRNSGNNIPTQRDDLGCFPGFISIISTMSIIQEEGILATTISLIIIAITVPHTTVMMAFIHTSSQCLDIERRIDAKPLIASHLTFTKHFADGLLTVIGFPQRFGLTFKQSVQSHIFLEQ